MFVACLIPMHKIYYLKKMLNLLLPRKFIACLASGCVWARAFQPNEQDDICFECIFVWVEHFRPEQSTLERVKEERKKKRTTTSSKGNIYEEWVTRAVSTRHCMNDICLVPLLSSMLLSKNYSVWHIIHHFRTRINCLIFSVCIVISVYHANECERIVGWLFFCVFVPTKELETFYFNGMNGIPISVWI